MKVISRNIAITATLAATLSIGVFMGCAIAAQPHMNSALHALQEANAELNVATPDKGGHRAKAIRLVDQAITEVNAGINFAQ